LDYLESIARVIERSRVFSGRRVFVTIIANPAAGGFTRKKNAAYNKAALAQAVRDVEGRAVVCTIASFAIEYTKASGHAREIADNVLVAALRADANDLYLIITAGGDGTSLEVQTSVARAILEAGHFSLSDRVCVLRLPFGTGNDGSDGRLLDQTLLLLTGDSTLVKQSAVRAWGQGGEGFHYAFNIASVGLDAFVTHMTNRLKRLFPGNFYKIWLDIACLFYGKFFPVETMIVSAYDKSMSVVREEKEQFLICVMGASGRRTYGSNQKILPDDRNVCAVRDLPLLKKLALKSRVKIGEHISFSEASLFEAHRIVIDYASPILVQFDGEAHLLTETAFPYVMELTDPCITVIRARQS